jgi:D-arabinose 1-dehydrogenase-like Zn-dependent alcohol dehydrogenase
MPETMRAVQVSQPGGDFELVAREVPTPRSGEALVRVHACGVCHSDVFAKEGGYPGVTHPVVPGHEIAGEIAALGDGVKGWEVGQRVGVGWFGGHCGYCEWCRRTAGDPAQAAGGASGTARDSEHTLNFRVLSGVRPMIETLPLESAAQAYEKMMSGQARFRMVLSTGAV